MNWKNPWKQIDFATWSSKPGVQKVRRVVTGKAFLSVLMVLLLGGAIGFHYFWTRQSVTQTNAAQSAPKATLAPAQDEGKEPEEELPASTAQGVFDAFRVQREDTRGQEVNYLQEILQDAQTDDATRAAAQLQLSQLTDSMEKELTMETLIQAKGFPRVIALTHENSLNIIVGAETLSEEDVAKILSIAMQESGKNADQIKIIPSVVQ